MDYSVMYAQMEDSAPPAHKYAAKMHSSRPQLVRSSMSLPSVLFQSSSASKQGFNPYSSSNASAMLAKVAASPLSRDRSPRTATPESSLRSDLCTEARSAATTPTGQVSEDKSRPHSGFEDGYFSFPDFDRLGNNTQNGASRKDETSRRA
ncbi:MAG: hypothetical protein M4579_003298 [Chaenotheca gracillima]|nr:MAG: hypothetical protein M4579_003298 [Chaenotheca gracillima]